MNRIYKLKFDKRRNELVVVSEITGGMGKEKSTGHLASLAALSPFRKLLGTLTPLALLTGFIISLFPGMALAADLPTGGQIVGGQGSISTSGNQMTIHQQTQNMATNWHSFDVGQNNTVQFVQPDSSSVALNRVTGASGSQIMGTLKANGQVFILNPNGVLFGKDARVNVAGLVASTKNINTADFMKGQYTLSGSGNPGAQVVNQGSLTTSKGGYIVLAGERVSNSGTVTTPGGKAVLAAGRTVTLQLDNGGLTSVSVNGSVVNALVENRGLISATNGQVYLTAKGQDMLLNTVVNNSGTIEAKGLESRGGEIVLNGGDSGVVSQSGQLLADSLTGPGGKITLEGQNIHLAANSLTSATGKTGGGEVYVGGGWQGQNSGIKNASKVVMDQAAMVDVSATDAGNGGTAVLWSDDYTNFRGTILAKGGSLSGNGGRVETSSHNNLQAFGSVDASANAGHGGEWLLDPTNVTIVGTGSNNNVTQTTNGEHIFTPTGNGAKILNTSIETQLNKGTNVTIKTSGTNTTGQSGDIVVNAGISKTKGGDATLTLNADRSILVNTDANGTGNITSTAGKLHVNLLAGGSSNGTVVVGRQIDTNGGDLSIDGVTGDNGQALHQVAIRLKGDSSIKAGNVSIAGASTQGITTSGGKPGNVSGIDFWGTIDATGNVTIKSADQINISRNENTTGDAVKGNIVKIESDAGNISLNRSNISAVNDITLKAGAGSITVSGLDTTKKANITSTNGNINITATGNQGGVVLKNVNLSATGANKTISISGSTAARTYPGDTFPDTLITGVGVTMKKSVSFVASNTVINAKNTWQPEDVTQVLSGQRASTGLVFSDSLDLSITGNATINASALAGGGILFQTAGNSENQHKISVTNGTLNINASTGDAPLSTGTGPAAIMFENVYAPNSVKFTLAGENANININASATNATTNIVPAFAASHPEATGAKWKNGFVFTGKGNVSVTGKANKGDGINARLLDNTGLTGKFTLLGESVSGNGVSFDRAVNAGLVNANITGSSSTGAGVTISTGDSSSQKADLNMNTIIGTSATGPGIQINGDNVTITNGTLKGSATSGTGAGISLNGGNNYTLDGVTVTGQSADGTGVSVGGTLTVNNGTVVNGTSSGSGTGVSVAGTLTTAEGADVTLNGKSESGDGVQVTGDTSLNHATVNGTSVSGTGLNVSGNASLSSAILTGSTGTGTGAVVNGTVNADEHSEINGLATAGGGTGVSVGGVLNGGSVNGSSTTGNAVHVTDGSQINGTDIRGTSQNGSAIKTEGQVSVNNAQLSGHSVNGADLDVSGTLSLGTDTKIDAETVVGHENIQGWKPDTPLPPDSGSDNPSAPSETEHDEPLSRLAEINSLRQGAVNAQVTHMNQPEQDGFHSAGTPPVPVDGYRPAAQTVDIRLCDGNACQLVVLDAAKPTGEKAASSGR
ncbi:filamentous hemagglutinin N-terminal domain-containing protein [Salmonella enterica subsp. enterica]|nr:filamentous hemagglutinin N-terminal domain-containing protein [Salmonella enterica subsp. enterica serovar Tanger]EED2887875.1 filamentous hemagglutinin N-terminal domain-containing protein [Salmonella enterica subsp. enterica serovar Tanger]